MFFFMHCKSSRKESLMVVLQMCGYLSAQARCVCHTACGRKWQTAVHTLCAGMQSGLKHGPNTDDCCDISLCTPAILETAATSKHWNTADWILWSHNNSDSHCDWGRRGCKCKAVRWGENAWRVTKPLKIWRHSRHKMQKVHYRCLYLNHTSFYLHDISLILRQVALVSWLVHSSTVHSGLRDTPSSNTYVLGITHPW